VCIIAYNHDPISRPRITKREDMNHTLVDTALKLGSFPANFVQFLLFVDINELKELPHWVDVKVRSRISCQGRELITPAVIPATTPTDIFHNRGAWSRISLLNTY
jgi:hypothetical protein